MVMVTSTAAALVLAATALAQQPAQAATIDGLWRSPPRKSGAWITVRVGPCDGAPEQRCGVVESAHDGANPEVVGEHVLLGLERRPDGSWADGRIVRPNKGTVYSSQIRLAGEDTLQVEGCAILGLVCRDQTWTRME
jgi:uncharacterized protein (DUF2147 family)